MNSGLGMLRFPSEISLISDFDIQRAALFLIKKHGADASIFAAMMADQMLDNGDLDGKRGWMRIITAIDSLQSTTRPEGADLH